jgi:predicted dehydrogenase
MNVVRWGVLSTAQHGRYTVAPSIRASTRGVLAAVASRDGDRARDYAKELEIPTVHGSYEALLADPNVDAVYIPLPNSLHKEWAIRAAQAGKHVLCEKPLALNAAEAAEMVEAFRGTGLKLAEAFQWRHHPQAMRVRELLHQGRIGELRLIEAAFSFMLDRPGDIRSKPEVGGGSLYDVGCYPVALARYMAGQEPLEVTAQGRWSQSGIDDLVVATVRFPGEIFAQLTCGFVLPLRREYEIFGSTGSLAVTYAYNPRADHPDQIIQYGDDREVVDVMPLEPVDSYVLMIDDFSAAVMGERELLFPPDDAVKNMRVIDAIYKALRDGGMVSVEQ